MAVDVDEMIGALAGGQGVRAGGAIPPGLKGYEERERYPYDVEAARRLLADAGYAEGFAMEVWQRESPEGTRILEAVQGYLKRVGVDVILVRREWSAFKEAVSSGRVDAFFLDWFADYPDAENFIYPLFHSHNAGGGGNRSFFDDAKIDSLIEAAARMVDESAGNELYGRIDGLVYDQAPWIYLYFPKTYYAISADLSGYRVPSLYLGNDYSSVYKTEN
jgi:peptide/nickel transport system substrate-binding protein/oligopeptide transport system substrate-binding protein